MGGGEKNERKSVVTMVIGGHGWVSVCISSEAK